MRVLLQGFGHEGFRGLEYGLCVQGPKYLAGTSQRPRSKRVPMLDVLAQ